MQDDIKKACDILRKGGIILYPTDTIWGIGCDATNEEAVKRIYDLKQRDDTKSMLVLMDNPAKLQTYVKEVPDIAWDLIDLADKPLTIIYDGAKNLAPNLIARTDPSAYVLQPKLFLWSYAGNSANRLYPHQPT
jgi:L-threonylcarbamoyladenylate synthase